jgi:exodeoxyribonuclease VII small subunit
MTKASQTPANGTSAQAQPNSYESAVQELEQLVARMESGQMPLADMLQS